MNESNLDGIHNWLGDAKDNCQTKSKTPSCMIVRMFYVSLISTLCAAGILSAAEPEIILRGGSGSQQFDVVSDQIAVLSPRGVAVQEAMQATGVVPIAVSPGLAVVATGGGSAAERDQVARRAADASGLIPFAIIYPRGIAHTEANRCLLGKDVIIRLREGNDLAPILNNFPVKLYHRALYDDRTYVVSAVGDNLLIGYEVAQAIAAWPTVEYAQPDIRLEEKACGLPNDPLFAQQWHLTGGGPADINVQSVWNFTNGTGLGSGVVINVVDTGGEGHPDLDPNQRLDWGYSYRLNQQTQVLDTGDNHGMFCAGLAAAKGNNSLGGSGVAPSATLVPVQFLGWSASTPADAAEQALNHNVSTPIAGASPWVSTNSWAPVANFLGVLTSNRNTALNNAVTVGRSGRGLIFCFAAGNGWWYAPGEGGDNANYSQQNSCRYVIPVGSIDHYGRQDDWFYSNSAAGLMVVAPGGQNITLSNPAGPAYPLKKEQISVDRVGINGYDTTNVAGGGGIGDYTTDQSGPNGTSMSTPIVAGAIALVLEENPYLTYRDVQHIIARHSVQTDSADWLEADAQVSKLSAFRQPASVRALNRWQTNAAGVKHSVRYGFGKVDVAKWVQAAQAWTLVPAATSLTANNLIGASLISDAPTTDSVAGYGNGIISVSGVSTSFFAEHIELHVKVTHPNRGQLSYVLTSPSGSKTYIERRPNDTAANLDYTFTSVAHWGENPNGYWSLFVYDWVSGQTGSLDDWSLTIRGHEPYATPSITGISPSSIYHSNGAALVTLTGTGFARNAANEVLMTRVRVRVNGGSFVDLPATWVSATQLAVTIPNGLLTGVGTIEFTAGNPVFASQFSGTPGVIGTKTYSDSTATTQPVVSLPPAPVITSAATASAVVGNAFTYTIIASNGPTSFGAVGLPAGLSVNTSTGVISGVPVGPAATVSVQVSASNAGGTGSATLSLVVTKLNGPGDLNGDGVVNVSDLSLVTAHFGQTTSDANWDARADANGDGIVNVVDLSLVTSNFGKSY